MPPASPSGTWRLTSEVAGIGHSDIEMTIQGDSAVSGFSGCNRFFGPVKIAAAGMTFGPLATTRRACEPRVMELENAVMVALAATAYHRLEDTVLSLLDEEESELLIWARDPAPPSR